MELQNKLVSLLEHLQKGESELISCLGLIENSDKEVSEEMLSELTVCHGNLSLLIREIKDIAELDIEENSVVQFMNRMLKLEYHCVFDYILFADCIENDSELSEKLREFGKTEVEHSKVLIKRIRAQGGLPRLNPEAETKMKELTIGEMFEYLLKMEKASVSLCEKGLSVFQDPEFQWVFQTIMNDGQKHIVELNKLICTVNGLENSVLVQSRYNHPKDIDFNSDEPWIEG